MVTKLVDFRKNIAHITVPLLLSKSGTKIDEGGVKGALLNDLSKAFEFILLGLFNKKLHAYSLDSHMQRICKAYFGRIKVYLRHQTSMTELLVKIGNS